MSLFNCARKLGIVASRTNRRGTYVQKYQWLRPLPNLKLYGQCFVNNRFSTYPELSLSSVIVKRYLDYVICEYKKVKKGGNSSLDIVRMQLSANLLDKRFEVAENIKCLEELCEADKELKRLVNDERLTYELQLAKLDEDLLNIILTDIGRNDARSIILEVSAGVGGQEAMLFAKDLWNMYLGYIEYLGFDYDILECNTSTLGGIRHGSISISGERAFEILRHEGGVHRVQRIPLTEKHGKLHTSTVTVAVLQEPTEIQVVLHEKDLRIETKRSSGAGGQHVNTTDSCVRITHLPTGISSECQTGRSQIQNKETALLKLRTEIYKRQLNEQLATASEHRKKQMGMGFRNEKIRTYNFQQNRITDHRLTGGTVHNLEGFLEGGAALKSLQDRLQQELQKSILLDMMKDFEKNST